MRSAVKGTIQALLLLLIVSTSTARYSCASERKPHHSLASSLKAGFRAQGRPKQFVINLTIFIPANYVIGGLLDRCGSARELYYAGDDRSFDPKASSFRVRQSVTVEGRTVSIAGFTRFEWVTTSNLVNMGTTKSYAPDALADKRIDAQDDDERLFDCHLLNDRSIGKRHNIHAYVDSSGRAAFTIHLYGSASNPLAVAPDLLKSIDWDFLVTVDVGGSRWNYRVEHDGFPAFELYVNDQGIYSQKPDPPYSRHKIASGLSLKSVRRSESGALR